MTVPADILSALVTILALVLFFYMGFRVGGMRGKHGIKAPAMTGHPEMERAVRVHMNTLEQLVVFLPLLWIATTYFRALGWLPALVGLVWIVGRIIYMNAYMADPDKRSAGFGVTALSTLILLVLSLWGIVSGWMAATAT
jgi:glutathione S-transferase